MLPLADQHALIDAHLPAAEQCAKKFVRRSSGSFQYDEFLSAAYHGLVSAARTYDPDHASGASFATFAFRAMDGAIFKMLRAWKRQNGWVQEQGRLTRVVRLKSLSRWDGEDSGGFSAQSSTDDVPDPTVPFPALQQALDGSKVLALCRTPQERRIVQGRLQGLTYQQIAALPGVRVTKQRVWQVWARFQQRARAALTLPAGGGGPATTR